jgi:DNA-binding sugar fermentation-stimulating protein
VVQGGSEAVCLFIIQRGDCAAFAPCYQKDPAYALATAAAAAAGAVQQGIKGPASLQRCTQAASN